jgi:DNA-binding LytR/AlgR family response regulator
MTNRIDKEMVLVNNQLILIKDVKYIKGDRYASVIHFKDKKNQKLLVSKPLKVMEDLFMSQFLFRINKSLIIDLNLIVGIAIGKRYNIITSEGEQIRTYEKNWRFFSGKLKNTRYLDASVFQEMYVL